MDGSNIEIEDIPSKKNKRVILCGSGGSALSNALMVKRITEHKAFKDDTVIILGGDGKCRTELIEAIQTSEICDDGKISSAVYDVEEAKLYLIEHGIDVDNMTNAIKDLYAAISEAVLTIATPAIEKLISMSKEMNEYFEAECVKEREFRVEQRRSIYAMPKKQQQMQCRYNNKMQKKQSSKRRRTY